MTWLFGRVAIVCLAGSVLCSACGETGAVRAPSVSGPTPLPVAPLAALSAPSHGHEFGARQHEESGLSQTITRVVLTALHRGVTGSGSVLSSPRWSASCPGGGDARIELPDTLPFIGEVSLANTTTVWTECGYERPADFGGFGRATGRTTLNGRWSSSAPSSPIQIQGSLDVRDYRPWDVDLRVDGATGVFNGQIGIWPVNGVVDGPFIPRPTPEPTPTPTPTPTPDPTPTPEPTPTPQPSPGQFDGLYTGQIDSSTVSGGFSPGINIVFQLSGGAIVPTFSSFGLCAAALGGTWTGGVDSNGIAQFDGRGTVGPQTYTCSVSGVFVASGSTVTGSGTFSVTVMLSSGLVVETGGGRWSVTRVPGS